MEARRFPSACVASPHHLASSAGLAVLAEGGNAVDAAVAANLVLGVVAPYLCGYGGDLFALVWRDRAFGYAGAGRAPASATPEAVRDAAVDPEELRAAGDSMPERGPLTVTVPGAVRGWFDLLDRFGSRPFPHLAETAIGYARDGFVVSATGMERLRAAGEIFRWSAEWRQVYGGAEEGRVLRQPDLATAIETLGHDGPDALYRGPIGKAIAEHVRSLGGLLAEEDLAAHEGGWIEPLRTEYRGIHVLELPPPTQGVAALEALNIVQAAGALPRDAVDREHLLIEAMKLALADRNAHVTDPDHMAGVSPEALAGAEWGRRRSRDIRREASSPDPGRSATGGTAYVCSADPDGTLVSLIQSNYMGFGSGLTVPGWGINLQNRGSYFSLDRGYPNVIAPRKRTLHTLIPALALRGGRPWLVFGTMGADGQAQTHLQLLVRVVDDGEDVQRAIDAPRWRVLPTTWALHAESRFAPDLLQGLRDRGHQVFEVAAYDSLMGHAHAILVAENGYAGATDPRTEGAVVGL